MTNREDTEARLQRLEDLEEIRELFIEYKRVLDGKDFAAYASLFATDGEFIAGEMHAKGRAEIQALVEGMLGNLLTDERGNDFHLVINPSVRIDGDPRDGGGHVGLRGSGRGRSAGPRQARPLRRRAHPRGRPLEVLAPLRADRHPGRLTTASRPRRAPPGRVSAAGSRPRTRADRRDSRR